MFSERMKYVRDAMTDLKSSCITVDTAGELFTKYITRAPNAIENAKVTSNN